MYVVEYLKQSCFVFLLVLKNKDQDCVDAAIMSDALSQDTEAFEREFEAKIFFVHPRKIHSCVTMSSA